MFDLQAFQEEVGDWSRRNFDNQASYHPLLGVAEEVGELCHAHLKQEQGIRTSEDHVTGAKDAIGDILIYMADYCCRRGFDLESCVSAAWNQVKKRDWKKNPGEGKPCGA